MTIAWGAFAFGATYPWASWPLMVACLATGALAWIAVPTTPSRAPVVALAMVGVAIAVQLIPLPVDVLAAVSPQTVDAVAKLSDTLTPTVDAHPVSVVPQATWRALALFVALGVFLIGLMKLLAAAGSRWLLVGVTFVGVVLAVTGIVQKASGNGMIYGLWMPEMSSKPFGPFINRNHFAGWMLMALPLTLALMCVGISRGMRYVPPTLRDRLLWLGSRDASHVILSGGAALAMGIALVMTLSRSGISAFVLAAGVTIAFVARGMRARARRSVAGIYLAGLVVLVLAWVGIGAVVTRFADADWSDLNGRLESWSETARIATMYPLTGTGLNTFSVMAVVLPQTDRATRFDQSHNDYLQLWSEGGLLLAIPVVVLIVICMRDVLRRFKEDDPESSAWWARAGAVTGLLSIGLQETVEFSLQMPGNAALFIALCALALHSTSRSGDARTNP